MAVRPRTRFGQTSLFLATSVLMSCSTVIGLDEFRAGSDGGVGNAAGAGTGAASGSSGASGANASGGAGATSAAGGGGTVSGGSGGTAGTQGDRQVLTIAQVRGLPNGPVHGIIKGVYVTYVRAHGYHIQASREGLALEVSVGSDVPSVAVGNKIDLEVDSVTDYFLRTKRIDGSTVVANDMGSYDVSQNLATVLSKGGGVALDEYFEGKLVRIEGGEVWPQGPPRWYVRYGSLSITGQLHAADSPGLCSGATVTIEAPVQDWPDGYFVVSEYSSDLTMLNQAGCGQ